jgi:hypothetical protein
MFNSFTNVIGKRFYCSFVAKAFKDFNSCFGELFAKIKFLRYQLKGPPHHLLPDLIEFTACLLIFFYQIKKWSKKSVTYRAYREDGVVEIQNECFFAHSQI